MNNGKRLKKQKFWIILLLCYFVIQLSLISAQNPTFDSLANEISRISYYQKVKSFELLDTLYQIAYLSPDSSLFIARCIYEESTLNYRQGILDSTMTNIIMKRLNNKLSLYEHALLQSALGKNIEMTGEYSEAFSLYLQALEKYKKINLNRFVAITLNALGNICYYIGLYNLSDYYHSEAILYVIPEWHEYYAIKHNIFKNEIFINNNEAAVDSMLFLIEAAEKTENIETLLYIYSNLGGYFISINPEKAFYFFTKLDSLNYENSKIKGLYYLNLSVYNYVSYNDFPKSLFYLKEAEKILQGNGDINNLSVVYDNFSYFFEEQNQLDSALFYARKHSDIIIKLRSNTIAIETHQKYITNLLETQQKDLLIADQNIRLKNRLLTIFGLAILIALLITILFYKQKKLKIKENREITLNLEHQKKATQYEKKQRKIEKEKHNEAVSEKTREVTSYSLLLTGKNDLLKHIQEIIAKKEDVVKTTNEINNIIQSNLKVDDEWQNFKLHFEKVHPKFFKKLKKINSKLTEENLKMCVYVKLGLTTKQISKILNIADSSVRISRHRLKEKLKLPEEENLDNFLSNL